MINCKEFLIKNKFRIYFCFLLLFLIIQPLPTPKYVDNMLAWILLGIFCFSPYFITQKRKMLMVPFFLLSSIFLNNLFSREDGYYVIDTTLTIIILVQYFLVIIYILWNTVRQEVISDDMIFSGLTGFFLLGIGFSFVYTVLQDFGFASYMTNDGVVNVLTSSDVIYFSLSNLSALGIGDITPNNDIFKRIVVLESSIGTLYVAVFIGRLVGMSGIGHKYNKKNDIHQDE